MADLLDFAGLWSLSRRIADRRANRLARFEGTASLVPYDRGLRYEEEGLLDLGDGPPLRATRAYLWRPDGDGIEVLFADGRPFHRFTPRGRATGTDHPCGADLYRVAYDFGTWPAWTAEWTVTGPAKDYGMTSAYARPPDNLLRARPSATTAGLGDNGGP